MASTLGQLRDGLEYVRSHRSIRWTLTYLAITASLIGVLGVLGPAFASQALNLTTEGFVVVVLPLAAGLVMGILALNVYGKYVSRRRVIEGGLVTMAAALAVLAIAGWGSRGPGTQLLPIDLGPLVSLLSVVVALAFVLGIAYAFVAVPAQTQLQEELPADIRGRVFGVLNMLVSIASFLPIIIVGPVADLVGTPLVIMVCAMLVGLTGLASVLKADPPIVGPAAPSGRHAPADPVAVTSVPLSHPIDLRSGDTSTEADGLAADLPRSAGPGSPGGGSSSTR
ncbi:MAG: MFS transporter [Chloroflexi bacterium]|nr:MFS transporter [Chloroflexota bacterium]